MTNYISIVSTTLLVYHGNAQHCKVDIYVDHNNIVINYSVMPSVIIPLGIPLGIYMTSLNHYIHIHTLILKHKLPNHD